MISDKGVPVICCGTKMEELIPNTVEASTEKHLPVVEVVGNTNNNISLYAISSTTFGDNNAESADNTKQYGINTLV
jgi:hypothetical protein